MPCRLYKPTNDKQAATIHPYDGRNTFDTWGIDWVCSLVETEKGYKYLITAIDIAAGQHSSIMCFTRSIAAPLDLSDIVARISLEVAKSVVVMRYLFPLSSMTRSSYLPTYVAKASHPNEDFPFR